MDRLFSNTDKLQRNGMVVIIRENPDSDFLTLHLRKNGAILGIRRVKKELTKGIASVADDMILAYAMTVGNDEIYEARIVPKRERLVINMEA